MLEQLTIRQVALIGEAVIRFHGGMQALTGETGAGKSIVVDSVNLILGGRADREMIRSGSEKASVEAVFTSRGNRAVQAFMENEGIDYDGETVTVYREISAGGKNICRVCGVMIPVSRLKDLAVSLMDLHGQSEHQFLADPDRHLAFLDQTGDEQHRALLEKVQGDWSRFIANHRAYAKLVKQNENREARMRSLERDLEELRKAAVQPGETEELLAKRKTLEKAEKQSETLRAVSGKLSGGEGGGSLQCVKEAAASLKAMAGADGKASELGERCEAVYYELEDIAYQVSLMTERTGHDPGALEKTDERLDLIHRLERKFASGAEELPAVLAKAEEEYRLLADLSNEIEQTAAEHKRLLAAYRQSARELTESRRRLAAVFEQKIMKELSDLGMERTRFSVAFLANETGRPLMPSETGDDRVEFLISPNPGEPLKPLAKIASGGELSRLMLAVKCLESARNGVDAMVFDEIDTGISGQMAQAVAEKMITISRERQVICVTHLPQIAAAADYQYLVSKTVEGGRTETSVKELDREGRTAEISRMISGADGVTAESEAYAARMLKAAEGKKTKHHAS